MALPPGFLDELRTRLSITQVVGRKVTWDLRKSNQGKGDMWAPCPFHQEKTASFHVDDRKGFYYCFGCQAKGDAINFVQETENASFMEAVEILAGEAGMPMPAADPQAREKADRRTELTEVMEQAVRFYRLQLKTGAAAEARAYLTRRGLSEQALERWEIGFAPEGWQGLWDHLTGKGVAAELILEAGLAKPSAKGRQPYDVFRHRIMFPIRDGRGRAIAFGGRAMDPNDNAKYLNSPETPLFDKGRNLYNHGPARSASGKDTPLILAEGYMDVIALSEAGFGGAVAPLGTAVTEDQLRLLWRIHPEPIVALDGDKAGLRAAYRLLDLALPLIEAGQSLRFVLLPEGKDPDDLLRSAGAPAMQALLDQAEPMVRLLWRRETEGRVLDSPERRAAFDKELRMAVAKIQDPSIKGHYGAEIRRLREDLFGFNRPGPPRNAGRQAGGFREARGKWTPAAAPVQATLGSRLVGDAGAGDVALREAVILATLIHTPTILERFAHILEERDFSTEAHRTIARALLQADPATPGDLREHVAHLAGPGALDQLMAPAHVRLAPSIRAPGDEELAELCIGSELAKLSAMHCAEAEISEAMQELTDLEVTEDSDDAPLSWRLRVAAEARAKALTSTEGDKADFDIADNGVRLDRDERSSFDALIASIGISPSSDSR